MTDRLPSDADAVRTTRARVARYGGTRRPCVRLAEDAGLVDAEFLRLVLDGTTYHAGVHRDATGPLLRGAYRNRRLARNPDEGENQLVAWLERVDRSPGDALEFDEVVPGDLYGLRLPGRRAVYAVTQEPSGSLTDIARNLDGDGK
ncbi:MAG: hypothetical protein V5A46_08505 [Haloferacaceae archaeon]